MDPILLGVIGIAVVAAAYWALSRKRGSGGAAGSWRSYSSPDGAFSLAYPPDWLTRDRIDGPLSPGSSFVAMDPTGCGLLEVFLLEQRAPEFYVKMWEEDQKGVHPDTRVLSTTSFPLGDGRSCPRLTLSYSERTIAGTTGSFTTDYFLIDAGSRVVSLNFKALASRYEGLKGTIEGVVRAVRPGRG